MDKDREVEEIRLTNDAVKQELGYYIRNAPRVKTTVHWWDLYGSHYVGIKTDIQKQIFEEAIKKAGSITELARKMDVGRKRVSECAALQHRPNIYLLKKICEYINFQKTIIEKNIVNIGRSSFKPKLPFKMHNKEGVEIRAAFLCDGHVPSEPVKCPIYSAYEGELHWRLIELSRKIFGDFPCEPRKGNKSLQTRLPSPTGTVLELGGVPRGDKRLVNIPVPRDILIGNKKLQRVYLKRTFDDEGDVCFDKYGKRAVRITRSIDVTKRTPNPYIQPQKWVGTKLNLSKNNLLYGELLLLRKFGINAKLYYEGIYRSIKGKITAKHRIQIAQQDDLKKFAKLINFNLKEKRKKLQLALNSFKRKKFADGEGENFTVEVLRPIHKKYGYFRFGDLGRALEKTGRTYDLAGRYLEILTKKKIIRKMKRGIYEFIN